MGGPTLTRYIRQDTGNVYYRETALDGRTTVLALFAGVQRRL